MSRSVLTLRSAVLIMHAVFYVPSVVAVPVLRPANASERAGHCIPGLQSHRNNLRNEVGVKSSTDVTSDRVAVGYELIAGTCSLAMPVIVKASALALVAPFNLDGERVSGKGLGATDASPLRHQTEHALSLQPPLLGHEPNWSHEPALAEYALPQQRLLPSHELDRKSSCAEYALPPQHWLPSHELNQYCSRAGLATTSASADCALPPQHSMTSRERGQVQRKSAR